MKDTWYFDDGKFDSIKHLDFKNKDGVTRLLTTVMLQRTNSMFKWNNLPDTIPQDYLENLLQVNGCCGIIMKDDKLFAVIGGVGGIRNYNYQPTKLIVSNPYLLENSSAYDIYYTKEEVKSPLKDTLATKGKCVVVQNDNLYAGLLPLCNFYASQLTENIISKRMVTILSRATYVFSASDDDTAQDFKDFIDNVTQGEFDCIVSEGILGDGAVNSVQTLPLAEKGHQALTDLIEDQQYIKASWFNDLGLQANYNMKRESINSNESQLNKDAVLPFVDNMLAMRKLACKRINELFGTNISVEFASAWGYTRDTIEQAIDAIDASSEMKAGSEDEKPDQISGQENEGGDDNEQVQD